MFRQLFAILVTALLCTAQAAQAGSHVFDLDKVAKFDVLAGWRTAQGTRMAALRVRLAPGWKTYWRAPGDTGIPARFDWGRSRNVGAVRFMWPTPEVFNQNGARSVGYKDLLVLPIEVTPKTAGRPMTLAGEVEIGVCEEVCIPIKVRISQRLDGQGAPDARIKAALAARPDTAREAGLTAIACRVDAIADGLRVTAEMQLPRVGPDEAAVFELPDQSIWIAEAQTRRDGGRLTAVTELVPPSNKPFALDRSQLRITVLAAGRAVDIRGCAG